jgi:hypothetical protein
MKVRYKTDKCEVEVEGSDTKACFAELSGALEVFGSSTCGACDSTRTAPSVREVEGNKYYSVKCLDCGAELNFGQRRQDGALFPRRKNSKTNEWLPNNGWTKWQGKPQSDDAADFPETF